MRLSKNFTLKELTYSATALRLGIENEPSKEGIYKLTLLAAELLQPLRNAVGSIRITSGYRSPQLSELIGSSSNSQHCRYEAVDMQFVKRGVMNNLTIYNALIDLNLELVVIQFQSILTTLILELMQQNSVLSHLVNFISLQKIFK